MPSVFNLPGVPALSSYLPTPAIPFLADAAVSLIGALYKPIWGIFYRGIPVLLPDNYISVDVRMDFDLPTYPVEEGAFQSYNKVQLPPEVRVRVSAGGTLANRALFQQEVALQMNTTLLYDVVTPEKVYLNYNFHHMDIKRSANNGVGLLTFDLWLQNIGNSVTTTFSATQQPGDAAAEGAGNVQALPPASQIVSNLQNGTWQVH